MKKYVLFLLVFSSFLFINAQNDFVLEEEEQTYQIAVPCQCYCSDVCGPRDVKLTDTPFINEETGVCFCAPRDQANYYRNGCHLKLNKDFENSCCSK
ncbi:MAG: hypothetical protein WDZ41_02490 [Candidatus Babeliales bacterium]